MLKLLGGVCLVTYVLTHDVERTDRCGARIVGDHLEGGMLSAYNHQRTCLVMPDCKKSGYGVFSYDQKYLEFDTAGNQKAWDLIQTSKKEDDFKVEVTGEVQGSTIKVTALKLLP